MKGGEEKRNRPGVSKDADIPKLQAHVIHISHIQAREGPKVHIHARRDSIQHPLHLNLRSPLGRILRQLPLNIAPRLLPSLSTTLSPRGHYFRLNLPLSRLRENFPQERLNVCFRIASPLRALSIANAR